MPASGPSPAAQANLLPSPAHPLLPHKEELRFSYLACSWSLYLCAPRPSAPPPPTGMSSCLFPWLTILTSTQPHGAGPAKPVLCVQLFLRTQGPARGASPGTLASCCPGLNSLPPPAPRSRLHCPLGGPQGPWRDIFWGIRMGSRVRFHWRFVSMSRLCLLICTGFPLPTSCPKGRNPAYPGSCPRDSHWHKAAVDSGSGPLLTLFT